MNPVTNIVITIVPYVCNSCNMRIIAPDPRFHCLVCRDYDSCPHCQTTANFVAPHLGTHPTRTIASFDASGLPPAPSAAVQIPAQQALSTSHPQPQPSNTAADETITYQQQLHFHRQREQEAQNRLQQSFLDAQQIKQNQQLRRAQDYAYNCISEGLMNASGGWRTDSNGRRYYKEGLIK